MLGNGSRINKRIYGKRHYDTSLPSAAALIDPESTASAQHPSPKSSETVKITNFCTKRLRDTQEAFASPLDRERVANEKAKASQGPKLRQLYLDFGQKNLSHVTCPVCSMCYDRSFESDRTSHEKYHQSFIVDNWPIMSDKIEGPFPSLHRHGEGGTFEIAKQKVAIIEEDSNFKFYRLDLSLFLRRDHNGDGGERSSQFNLVELINKINRQMDAVEQKCVELERQIWFLAVEKTLDSKLFGSGKRWKHCKPVVAFLSVEPVLQGRLVRDNCYSHADLAVTDEFSVTEITTPLMMGISRVWTAPWVRRKGLARRLVRLASSLMSYPTTVPPHKIGFSQPTSLGYLFAKSIQKASLANLLAASNGELSKEAGRDSSSPYTCIVYSQ